MADHCPELQWQQAQWLAILFQQSQEAQLYHQLTTLTL